MTCKMKPLATQGNAFLEGGLHVIMVTVALATQRKCLVATKESPVPTAALCAPGAERNVHIKHWDIAGSEVEGHKTAKTFGVRKPLKLIKVKADFTVGSAK